MGIGDFFKRFTKGGEKEPAGDPETPAVPGRPRRRPAPHLPGWVKKDNAFVRPTMGMMAPPEDMAEEATFKRPGAWLKAKLGGGTQEKEELENLEKTRENRGNKPQGVSDVELEAFFHGLLDEAVEGSEPEVGKKTE